MTGPPTRDAHLARMRFVGQVFFLYSRGSQQCGKCRDDYHRVCRRNGGNVNMATTLYATVTTALPTPCPTGSYTQARPLPACLQPLHPSLLRTPSSVFTASLATPKPRGHSPLPSPPTSATPTIREERPPPRNRRLFKDRSRTPPKSLVTSSFYQRSSHYRPLSRLPRPKTLAFTRPPTKLSDLAFQFTNPRTQANDDPSVLPNDKKNMVYFS